MTFRENLIVGFAKGIIPLFSIIGMIQYSESNPIYAYGFAGLFILGYIINECVLGSKSLP